MNEELKGGIYFTFLWVAATAVALLYTTIWVVLICYVSSITGILAALCWERYRRMRGQR